MVKRFSVFLAAMILTAGVMAWAGMSESPEGKTPVTDFSQDEERQNTPWFRNTQIYGMVALPPDDVATYRITVNGLWNGFFAQDILSSPFALGRFLESFYSGNVYESDEDFVRGQHEQGLLVPGTILTTQGHRSLQGSQLETFACRSIDGALCSWDVEAQSYWMNASNPAFIDWCISHGKKAIDAGADMIVLDEIQGNGLIPMFQWASQYSTLPAPGFSDHTIEGFRTYLTDSYNAVSLLDLFGIADIASCDLRSRIAETMHLPYEKRVTQDPLSGVYFEFLDEDNFQAKKRLIEALRSHAATSGKAIVIGANSYALGTNRPGGHWPKGLHFSDLVDVFTFENQYTVFEQEPLPSFPRTKWLAWEKLARAATDAPAVILVDTRALEAINQRIFPLAGYSDYLYVLCAEAFANRGSFVNYHFRPFGRAYNWEGCRNAAGFIRQHTALYDTESVIPTSVAVLYLYGEGMRDKTDTYLGLAQALAESNIPFEVIFDGDGHYIEESLRLENLLPYAVVLIPSVSEITAAQKQRIMDYVSNGGRALVFDPEEIGFERIEGAAEFGDGSFFFMLEDIAAQYYQTYNDDLRAELARFVRTSVDDGITVENADRKIVACPYLQATEERMVLHVVNYDHRRLADRIIPKTDVHIRVKKPDFGVGEICVVSPDFEGKRILEPTIGADSIEFSIPTLSVYDVVIIGESPYDMP